MQQVNVTKQGKIVDFHQSHMPHPWSGSCPSALLTEAEKNSKDIWDTEEIPEGAEYETLHDPRPQPE